MPTILASAAAAQDGDARDEGDGLTVASEESGLEEEARIVYQAGVVAYGDQRFENALEYFERAYELSGRPQMLFNIGLVADRLRRDERAVEAYEAFLREMPDAENRPKVEERLRLLRGELAERQRLTTSRSSDSSDSGGPNVEAIVLLSIGGLALGGTVAGALWWADRADAASQCEARGCENVDTIRGERDAAMAVTISAGVAAVAATTIGIVLLASGGGGDAGDAGGVAACGVSPFGVSCAGRF